ncbi:hypothetical protein HYFRA_00012588 [Hymenoscyphus fraxineus]|uniref:Indole-diterpene biosynthesis protein PaxU n=1 Tax=Hymenoscyphus fraxineus TaxID=746836 RepID=A0A9N9L2X3_9HELO|nr:hypothetical protein HYFRA_00012588 [Hymenoscyphus fraxineus]
MSRPTALDHFTQLNHAVYLHQPANTRPPTSQDPDLILLLGWMDALPRHLSKYAAAYENLYPSSRILIVTTSALDISIYSRAANWKRVEPALEVLYSLDADGAKILMHLFSNGGAFTGMLLANGYREKMGKVLPVCGMVLDSSPGRTRHEATIRAFSLGMPKNVVLRTIGVFLLRVFLVCWRVNDILRRQPNLIDQVRVELNDPAVFEAGAKRLYVYSVNDDMVEWRDVEEHIKEAKERGYGVEVGRFEGSGHVAHMLFDSERYWGAVERLWGRTLE